MKKFEYLLVGAFAAVGATVIEIILDSLRLEVKVINSEVLFLVLFVFIEELAKFLVIWIKINFLDKLEIILGQCLWIGLGFGLLEFGLLSLNGSAIYSGNTLAIAAVLVIHIATTLLIGLMLARLKNNGYYSALAITPALVLHLAFNYWIFIR